MLSKSQVADIPQLLHVTPCRIEYRQAKPRKATLRKRHVAEAPQVLYATLTPCTIDPSQEAAALL